MPRCGLPARIINKQGLRLTVKNLLDHKVKMVHVADVVKINLPLDKYERDVWIDQFTRERHKRVFPNFPSTEVEQPQRKRANVT